MTEEHREDALTDDDGFVTFYASHRERVRRALALTLGDVALADEAVDEAMVRAFQRWSRVGALSDPAGWVFRVGSNWAVSRIRKQTRRPIRPLAELDRPTADPVPDVDLVRALRRLPRDQREVIVLRYFLDWQVDRIASALEVPSGTVKSRIHRALQSLAADREVRT